MKTYETIRQKAESIFEVYLRKVIEQRKYRLEVRKIYKVKLDDTKK